MLSIKNISAPSLSEDNYQQGMFQGENYSKHSKETARANSDSFADCKDVTPTQIIPPGRAPHENSVTDCDGTDVITNKPPQNELIEVDMTTQITNFENKQLFEEKPNENSVLLNNTHVKKNFDEVVDQFKRALQSSMNVKSENQNDPNENVITSDISDIADDSESIEVDSNNATQHNKGQREKSNDSLVVSSNTDDKVVQCPVNGNVTHNLKDENKIKYSGRGLPSQEQMGVLNESANVGTLTNVSDSSDDESSPKRSRQFTFSDSDLPNDDEIKEILMMYPKPKFIEPFNESESDSSSEDDSNRPICRRRRNKPEPVDLTKMLQELPEKVLTRLRKPPVRLGFEDIETNSSILKPTYLTAQDNEIDEDIIAENIRRFKAFEKRITNIDSKKQKSVKEEKKERSLRKKAGNKNNEHKKNIKVKPKRKNGKYKSKSNARKSAELKIKNTQDSLVSITSAKTTTTRTRSMKTEIDGKNTQNKRILQIKNTEDSLVPVSAAKTITTRTRSMKKENDGKNTQNKRILQIKNTEDSLVPVSAAKTITTRTRSMKKENDGENTQNKRIPQIKNTKGSLVPISTAKTTTTRTRSMKKENEGKNTQNKCILQIKNTKNSPVSITAAKTTTTRTRSIKEENDDNNTQNKRILQENRNKKLTNMKEKSSLAENKVRRSKRQPKVKQKNDGTMRAPISIVKKSIHEQSTVYNISTSSSESPKSLKRSLVDKSDVPSPKRTRFQNRSNNQELNNNNSRVKKTQHGHLSESHSKDLQHDKRGPYLYLEKCELEPKKRIRMLSNRNSLNMNTRTQSARRRSQRACQRSRDGGARR